MKNLLAPLVLLTFCTNAAATTGPNCTEDDVEKWMSETDFITMAEKLGYNTDKFIVTEGNCYALNKTGSADGEMNYFDPVTGSMVQ